MCSNLRVREGRQIFLLWLWARRCHKWNSRKALANNKSKFKLRSLEDHPTHFRPKRPYVMGLSVFPSARLLQRVQNHMSKGNKENQPERRNAWQALMTSLSMQSTLKRDLHREFYTLVISLHLEKGCQTVQRGRFSPRSFQRTDVSAHGRFSARTFQRTDVSAHGHFSAWTFQRGSPYLSHWN